MANKVAIRSMSRVWAFDGGAGPTIAPRYLALAAAQAVEKNFGDITRIEVPSQTERGAFDVVGEIQSGEENATLGLMVRYAPGVDYILKIANKKCIVDFQVHIGVCTSPTDFNHGWETGKILAFERGRLTSYSTEELGALQSDDEEAVNSEVEISANDFYEIGPVTFAERAKGEIAQEIVKVLVCDSPSCGDCENPSDGCQRVYAISAPAGSSPGLLPEVVVSEDGLQTIAQESPITTLAIGEDPDDAACVGDNLVVVSEDSTSLHYADLSDLIDGTETWAEITSGFVASKGPRAIDAVTAFDVYIAAAGGYIYYTDDPTSLVEVLDAGVATTENLNDIYAYSTEIIIAVGDNNAVVYTTNGSTFQSATGPAAGVSLTAVYARNEREWWVGTADGRLYYTRDQGSHWTLKGFTGSGTGAIEDIVFASNHVGYLSHTTAAGAGRILRTVSGGHSWYVLPDGSSTLPTNDKINSLALCKKDVNTVYAGGLGADAADGILLKGTTTLS